MALSPRLAGGLRAGPALHALLAILCALSMCNELSEAASVVDVFRMIQYDLGGAPFGSRKSSFNLYASANASALPKDDLARSILLMRIQQVDFSLLQDVVSGRKLVGGIILILPQSYGRGSSSGGEESGSDEDNAAVLDADTIGSIRMVEDALKRAHIPSPVYVALDNKDLSSVLDRIQRSEADGKPASATNGGHKLVVAVAEPRKIKNPQLTVLEAWLYGQPSGVGESDASSLPTLAIVAPYDAFGAAPALTPAANSNGSGVVALLELLRMFSHLFLRSRVRPHFNILFALTSGGPYNFDGTKQWLAGLEPRVLESIDYAFCLNSLGGGPGGTPAASPDLFLHVSKPLKNAAVHAIFQGLTSSAPPPLKLEAVHKKINVSDTRVPWEHELFSRHKVLAATLSALPSAPAAQFEAVGGLADVRSSVDDGLVLAAVKAVAETVANHMYGFGSNSDHNDTNPDPTAAADRRTSSGGIEFFTDATSLSASSVFVKHWLNFVASVPRVAAFLGSDSPIVLALYQELSARANKVERKTFPLNPNFVFYGVDTAKMYINEVASVSFDLLFMLLVALYLSALYVALHIATKGLDDFLGTFRAAPKRKSKQT